jgi:hypothetical protein
MSTPRLLLAVLLLALMLGAASWLGKARPSEPVGHEGVATTAREIEQPLAEPPARIVERATSIPAAPEASVVAPEAAPLRGRLVDAHTGEHVPWFDLEVRAPDLTTIACASDASGEFATPRALAAGKCTIQLVDFPGQSSTFSSAMQSVHAQHDPAAPATDLAIPVGPTYLVRADLPLYYPAQRFRVSLSLDPPEYGEDERAWGWPTTLLRDDVLRDGLPWARFRNKLMRDETAWLALVSDDGLWSGGARVAGGYGAHAAPVDIALHARCAVTGRYVTCGVEFDRAGGMLALFRVGGTTEPRWELALSETGFRISDLDPGRYRLEVRDEAVRAPPVEFSLTEGVLDLGELVWEPIPLAGPVQLTIVSAIEVPIDVELVRRADPPRHAPWHSDQWEKQSDGTFASVFEWEEVHAGEFEIALHSHETTTWHVSLGQLTPPVENLVLRLPNPPPPLQLDVHAANTGDTLAEWSVLVRQERGWMELDGPADAIASAVWDEHAALAVAHKGYRAGLLRPIELRQPTSGEWRVRVDLEPGWSGVFQSRTRVGGRPVGGAEIVLDGERAGTTDAAGELWVHRASAPAALEVRHAQLVLADEEPFDPEEPVTWLRLRPR